MNAAPIILSTILTMSLTAAPDYDAIVPELAEEVEGEMDQWNIGGVALALFDGERLIHAEGFGEAEADSIFRVGSVSKLFNAVAVMQQVERGALDLDAPIPADLLPLNPFPGNRAVTLRQLLSHRSGLQREVTVGGYFDASQPGLAATVADLRSGVLVTPPGEKTRYSNIGASLAGFMVERATGEDFASYQQKHIHDPLGMSTSAWSLAGLGAEKVIVSHMRVADGRGGWTRRDAPLFDLGTIPAGNLFSTVGDIARFGIALLNEGRGLIDPETLKEMWTPQLTDSDRGFGIAFAIGEFRGHRAIGHNGAVYGHSTAFSLLPDLDLGVVVVGNEDILNGRIQSIAHTALAMLVNAKTGQQPPSAPSEVPIKDLERFTGDYESESYWARLEVKDGTLVADFSGQPATLTPIGPAIFLANSRIENDSTVAFEVANDQPAQSFTRLGQTFTRVDADRPPLRPEWRKLLGTYGPEFIPLIVSERHGHLYAMTENMVDYRLTPSCPFVCDLPRGMYTGEQAVFLPDRDGAIHAVIFASIRLEKRP